MSLNLIDKLSKEDKQKIENYMTTFVVSKDRFIGIDTYLADWAKCNKHLYHLLGDFIVKVPIELDKDEGILFKEIENLTNKHHFRIAYKNFVYSNRDREQLYDINIDRLENLFTARNFTSNRLCTLTTPIKYQAPGKKLLQIQTSSKPMKAIQKVLQYFDADAALMKDFEDFRIQMSIITNDKKIKGNLCLSIHPLDFLTMSDNASDWSSCLSVKTQGCYSRGAVEMMNSNCVVCCYLESTSTPFVFNESLGELGTWNNKKWRTLIYATKDIIVSGKAYPYQNNPLAKAAIAKMRELAATNWKRSYRYGIEEYLDMEHIDSWEEINNNRDWIMCGDTKKHNILFDSKNMYNDFLNAYEVTYWCVRNKVKKNIIISMSGKARCACCNDTLLVENNMWDDYNDRYEDTDKLLCEDCYGESECDVCCKYTPNQKIVYIDDIGRRYCERCADKLIRICPCCGEPFELQPIGRTPLIRFNDNQLFRSEVEENFLVEHPGTDNFMFAYMCNHCLDTKALDEHSIEAVNFTSDRVWALPLGGHQFKGIYKPDDPEIQKYRYENLAKLKF